MSSFRLSAGILTARAARRPGSSTQTSFDEGTAPSPSCLSRKGEAGEATPRRVAGASESRPVARALAPAQVLRLGVEAAAVAVEGVPAEDRGDLEGVGEFIGALAPAHRALDQARDVKP